MTQSEKAVWIAVYAASWHKTVGGEPGLVSDEDRARYAARQAGMALRALKAIATHESRLNSSDQAIEVLS